MKISLLMSIALINGWKENTKNCVWSRFKDQLTSKERTLFFPPEEKLQEQMTKSTVRFALHFVFTLLARPDPFFEHWRNIAFDVEHTKSQVPLIDESNHARWYRNPSSIKKIEEEISSFNELVKTYKKDKQDVGLIKLLSVSCTPRCDAYCPLCKSLWLWDGPSWHQPYTTHHPSEGVATPFQGIRDSRDSGLKTHGPYGKFLGKCTRFCTHFATGLQTTFLSAR